MSEFPKQYIPSEHEDEIYKRWEESGFFNPDNIRSAKKYCNVLPPPNANGELHVGHASGYAFMDIFGRFERMNGKKVLLLPGKDHAGIQTQVVFEKKLKDERGTTRQKLGRDRFYKECYEFCRESADYMRAQEKKLGISADWSREKFTLDGEVIRTAVETFIKMHQDGMIYRGRRIVNWCPRCGTALSDIEVDRQEEKGKLYYIQYPIKNSKEFIVVATTRPETMLGDAAVAVHPKDKNYFDFIGKTAVLPLMEREIPIIADRRIDMDFGTGAVKITPAHDALDWQIGKTHSLPEYRVIDENARITKFGGKYKGQDVLEARRNILEDLGKLGLLGKEEEISISKLVCERCKSTIEPLISKQWFLNVDAKKYSLKKESLKAVRTGKINFFPERFRKIMVHWLSNLEDWCLSRQIWWGPRIPVWYCKDCGEEKYTVSIDKPKHCPHCGGTRLEQDPDTFDTWFSSGQWTYTTLGYPGGKDYADFYPTDMMIMGRDILFLWASRMIMMSLYRTKEIPFRNLYFTGLIRDKDGFKMSKSRGNGIDPLEMVSKFGSDALRLSAVMNVSPGQDSRLYQEKIESYRNFITKLWNIFRYAAQAEENFELSERISKRDIKTVAEKWIVSELEGTTKTVTDFMKKRNITLAQERLRKFTWDDFADWYVEINKSEKNRKVLGYVLGKILRMWHPFAPFATECIYGMLKRDQSLLMIDSWPKYEKKFTDRKFHQDFEDLRSLIIKIRNIRSNYHIKPEQVVGAFAEKGSERNIIERLARISFLDFPENRKKLVFVKTKTRSVGLDVAKLIDAEKEAEVITKEIRSLEGLIKKAKSTLNNKNFIKNAPQDILNSQKARLNKYEEKLALQEELLENLKYL